MGIRILHVLGALNRGGVENWLLNLIRSADRRDILMDFLVHTNDKAAYDDEVISLGANIYRCPNVSNPPIYVRKLVSILRTQGPYDVVHSHVHHFSGLILRTANKANVPVRIVHAHSDTRRTDKGAGLIRRVYIDLMRYWIKKYATSGIAASEEAATALWGIGWQGDSRLRILHCGIDLRQFYNVPDRSEVRTSLGISRKDLILGHVGSFGPPKNHSFLLDILKAALLINDNVRLMLVGDGPLRTSIQKQAYELNLSERVIFLGHRDDVPSLLMAAVDAFVFPSIYEGLPLSVLEAQAADVPIVLSKDVTPEVCVVPSLVEWISRSETPEAWAQVAIRKAQEKRLGRIGYYAIANSDFNINSGIKELIGIYRNIQLS